MLFHLFLHGWWLLEDGPLKSTFWWKWHYLEAKFVKIGKSWKIYGKSYFSRRRRKPEGGMEMGHKGPTPLPGACHPWSRHQVVWPPWPTSGSVLMRGELPLEVQDLEDDIAGLTTRIEKIQTDIEPVSYTHLRRAADSRHRHSSSRLPVR